MHICFICIEIFAWGKHGGFGRATRTIGSALANRDHQVTAIIPRRGDQRLEEILDGIRVLSFPMWNQALAFKLYRDVKADIYHSQEPSTSTLVAQLAAPQAVHVITFRDTRTPKDWHIEASLPTYHAVQVRLNRWYEDGPLAVQGVRRADGLFAASYIVQQKAMARYRLKQAPPLLPTPVKVPAQVDKAAEPTVCFVARMDRRKRPEMLFDLARKFPHVRFIAAGASHNLAYNTELEAKARIIPNLEWLGFVDQFDGDTLSQIYARSWIMINTAAREGLPNAFIEAAAHRCAILSTVDPDNFSSQYGFYASQDDLDKGLSWLLEENRWREKGEAGWRYVRGTYETGAAIQEHIRVYETLLAQQKETP